MICYISPVLHEYEDIVTWFTLTVLKININKIIPATLYTSFINLFQCVLACPEYYVSCGSDTQCVHESSICDGYTDCYNRADELGCGK